MTADAVELKEHGITYLVSRAWDLLEVISEEGIKLPKSVLWVFEPLVHALPDWRMDDAIKDAEEMERAEREEAQYHTARQRGWA